MIANLDHDTTMLHLAVDGLAHNVCAHERYLDRIKASVAQGLSIRLSDPTSKAMLDDIASLRAMADEIERCREALIGNAMPRLFVVGQEDLSHSESRAA